MRSWAGSGAGGGQGQLAQDQGQGPGRCHGQSLLAQGQGQALIAQDPHLPDQGLLTHPTVEIVQGARTEATLFHHRQLSMS